MKCPYFLILAVSFMIFYNVACGLNLHDCGSDHGKLKYISVAGCQTGCVLKRGSTVPITVGFTVSEKATDEVQAVAYAEDESTLYPFGASFVCKKGGLQCPLQIGTNYNYKGVLKVHEGTPEKATVAWQLIGPRQKKFICVQFNATFV